MRKFAPALLALVMVVLLGATAAEAFLEASEMEGEGNLTMERTNVNNKTLDDRTALCELHGERLWCRT